MKNIRSLSQEANSLREKFQKEIVIKYIRENGSLKGYKHQIDLMLPDYDKRLRFYKGITKDAYKELHTYLFSNQSQRIFSKYTFSNDLIEVSKFRARDLSICYNRVWHNGVTAYHGKHWAAQAAALRDAIGIYGFTSYEHDYNFSAEHHKGLNSANPLLKSIYTRIIKEKLG